jgi:hypothetical protein
MFNRKLTKFLLGTLMCVGFLTVPVPASAGVESLYLLNRDGRLENFWRGDDCALWHKWQTSPGGDWSAPYSLGGCIVGKIDGETNADGRLEVFVRGTDDALHHIWQLEPGRGWGDWHSLNGVLRSEPYTYLTQYGGIYVRVIGTDGNWWVNRQAEAGCCWTGWYRI